MVSKFWKLISIVLFFLILIGFYWTRNQVVAVHYPYAPAFYKIDRFTGNIKLVVGKEFVMVKEIDEKTIKPETMPPENSSNVTSKESTLPKINQDSKK